MQFFTIGVFNSGKEEYFRKLTENKIDLFCDIRQRRGVRGTEYMFVNSNRLQQSLKDLGIAYQHVSGLTPTDEIRQKQLHEDKLQHMGIRSRETVGETFRKEYTKQILDKFDLNQFIEEIQKAGYKRIVFFCVEEKPEACHRSLVAERLREKGYKVNHL